MQYHVGMKRGTIIAAFLVLISLACSLGSNANQATPLNTSGTEPLALPAQDSNAKGAVTSKGSDCYGDEIHPMGKSIADLYENTNYEEVMQWFCSGFLFEDILTALQTAEQTSTTPADLLSMYENGQTWEEIWLELGLIEP